MKLFIDYADFSRTTGRIIDNDRLEGLSLYPCTRLGQFEPEQLPALIAFCESNPSYHIISLMDGLFFINALKHNAFAYYLGTGDKTKNFFCSRTVKCGFTSEISIFDMDQTSTMISDGKCIGNSSIQCATFKDPTLLKKL